MRTSSVAVRPIRFLALAVSCTPGSCTTMRSAPCCWMMGSATPSSLMRLFRVLMFCLMESPCSLSWASGVSVATSLKSLPSGCAARANSGMLLASTLRTRSRVSASRKRMDRALPSRAMPAWRRFLSRSWLRISAAIESRRLVIAPFMSTCNRKCTPPRRSRPRYMGSARMEVSHCGEEDSRLSATL